MKSSEITAGPGASGAVGREDEALGVLVERDRQRSGASPPPGSSAALSTVSSAAWRTISSTASCTSDLDVHLAGEGGVLEVGGEAQRVATRLDGVGQPVRADGSAPSGGGRVGHWAQATRACSRALVPVAACRRVACRAVNDASSGPDASPDVVSTSSPSALPWSTS